MSTEIDVAKRSELAALLTRAFDEVLQAILAELKNGKKPSRVAPFPEYSVRDNGMPNLSDGGYWSGNGPLDYASVLEPSFNDDEARRAGKLPKSRFPAFHALLEYLENNQNASYTYSERLSQPILNSLLELKIERAASEFVRRFGALTPDSTTRTAVLAPILRAMLSDRLDIAFIVPVSLTHFEADRFRLGPKEFLVRMSPNLQRSRWRAKTHGANGHDSVLAAATHAFVLTGYDVKNAGYFELHNCLTQYSEDIRRRIDLLFASLRIVTGIETGYAQELRLARRWTLLHDHGLPSVYATGARRYPEIFDNFGWTAEHFPKVTRSQMEEVRSLFQILETLKQERLHLAIRRLNSAMIRSDVADTILDATIALEILLGDTGEAISWKLRLRAAALAKMAKDGEAGLAMHDAIKSIYDLRSEIVHGKRQRKDKLADQMERHQTVRNKALDALRQLLKIIISRPEHLDPGRIDKELMIGVCPTKELPDNPNDEHSR